MSQITKKAMASSLKKLLETKTLSKITVSDITDDCGINRHTFYYHFQDIYDLIEWIYKSETAKVLQEHDTYDSWQEGVRALFQYAIENKNFVENTYHSISKEYLIDHLYQVTYNLLIHVVEEQAQGIHVDTKHKEFIAHFYKYAFVGMAIDWIDQGMKSDYENIITDLSTLIEGDFHKALLRFERKY
ncbi:TetR/AcrR family transcriptional regulator [Candidatus Stoquefichus massiliensis]|uniref:TetR/AcrR family transcriptional regulator n=1 Tax=Candidatus Stoquefichus massiliensis TaxID=1470350 RepID=UPI0004846676|nr:TetR-like C-terminal domain-containing protein [Candidatus Stoquefichus massiliensis]